MSAISNNLENQLLNALLDAQPYPTHSTVWLALFDATQDLEANSFAGEISASGYARQIVNFGTASGGEISNSQAVTFTPTGTWTGIRAIAVVTAAGGVQGNGEILFWTLIPTLTAQSGVNLVINPGELKVRLN